MRLLVDISTWGHPSGFGRYTRELVRALARTERASLLLLADRETAQGGDLPGGCLVVSPPRRGPAVAGPAGNRPLRDLLTLSVSLFKARPEAVFFPTPAACFPVLNRAVPVILAVHDLLSEEEPGLLFQSRRSRWFWRAKFRLALLQAAAVVTVSQTSRQALLRALRLPPSRVHVVPGAPARLFGPAEPGPERRALLTRHGLTAEEPFFLYVGALTPHKDLLTLVRALAHLRARRPGTGASCLVVGSVAEPWAQVYRPRLEAEAAKCGVRGRLRFAGYVSDAELAELYRAACALVLPSRAEGFGLPAVEAMASGTPVVASRAGALPEVLGPAGLLFPPGDAEALALHLKVLLDQPALRQALRERGFRQVRRYSWSESARRLLAVLAAVQT